LLLTPSIEQSADGKDGDEGDLVTNAVSKIADLTAIFGALLLRGKDYMANENVIHRQ